MTRPGWQRRATGALAAVVALHLWSIRQVLELVSWPNDLSFHLSMISWAEGRFRAGQVPTDGWFPRLSAGLPQFHLYQSLPHVLTGALGVPLGSERAAHLLLWLLVGTFPIPVFIGARAFGLSVRASLVAAAVAPLVHSPTGYGFEDFSYLWTGNGLWSQAWGMWVAPLALGWSARAVREGRGYGRAVLAIALTVAFHLPTAWFVLVAIGLWVVIRPSEWKRRLPRAAGVGALTVAASAWMLVPFIVDRWAAIDSSFNGEGYFRSSFGLRRVVGWTLAGDIIDARHLPVLSVVAGVGLLACLARWRTGRTGDREVLAVAGLSLVLFVGTHPFGPLIALLPGSSQVFLHRYIATFQLGMVLLVGLGADDLLERHARWSADRAPTLARRFRVPAAVLLCLLAAAPAVLASRSMLREDRSWVTYQERADRGAGRDAAELVAIAEARGGGRIYAGKLNGWGGRFWIGSVQAPIWLAQYPVDSLGFNLRVSALAADIETYLDESTAADLDGLGIRYLLVPRGKTPPRGAWFLAQRGEIDLWEIPGDGMVSAVNVIGPVFRVDNDDLAEKLLPFLRVQGGSPAAVRLLDVGGRSPSMPLQSADLDRRPGTVDHTVVDLDAGSVRTEAHFDRPGAVMVKANWHPRWTATVDGEQVPVGAVAPTWLAVPVGPGDHQVVIRYRPWPYTPPLLVVAVASVGAGAWWSRRASRRRSEPADTAGGQSDGRDDRPRPLRPRTVGVASLALVLAGCGSPHVLPATSAPRLRPDAPLAQVHLLRPDSLATLDEVVAPDRLTVLVVASPACTACAALLDPLLDAAFGEHPYSLIALAAPAFPAGMEQVAADLKLSTWSVASSIPRSSALLHLGARGGVTVVRPDGSVVRSWDDPASATPIINFLRKGS